ncbi:hypothetical protein CQA66_05020 [Helicobacter aurati]|uniref:Uncharacterized protein n=1 Tax=Helicobacter aurati TaxID=137778 RepID=A0A3D8J695_9HELI|nr:hypothetical protein [Helicobacter aurati]RDU72424.1 hypothetical protein CQA66_05020 [Helicobacter aurati]
MNPRRELQGFNALYLEFDELYHQNSLAMRLSDSTCSLFITSLNLTMIACREILPIIILQARK